jgi:hypothetical protein
MQRDRRPTPPTYASPAASRAASAIGALASNGISLLHPGPPKQLAIVEDGVSWARSNRIGCQVAVNDQTAETETTTG